MRGKSRTKKSRRFFPGGFNEARALCAGSPDHRAFHGANGAASMRPAHYAREVRIQSNKAQAQMAASMRPAHYAREVRTSRHTAGRGSNRFNEARALCAGSQIRMQQHLQQIHASMRPAHYAREVARKRDRRMRHHRASMRPAHYAREVPTGFNSSWANGKLQ